jgi:hypothetical protein
MIQFDGTSNTAYAREKSDTATAWFVSVLRFRWSRLSSVSSFQDFGVADVAAVEVVEEVDPGAEGEDAEVHLAAETPGVVFVFDEHGGGGVGWDLGVGFVWSPCSRRAAARSGPNIRSSIRFSSDHQM